MTIAAQYATGLRELVEKHPERGREYLTNLRAVLQRRGHEKLLSRIFSEYEKLELYDARRVQHARVTPEMRRTRALLELYRKFIAVS